MVTIEKRWKSGQLGKTYFLNIEKHITIRCRNSLEVQLSTEYLGFFRISEGSGPPQIFWWVPVMSGMSLLCVRFRSSSTPQHLRYNTNVTLLRCEEQWRDAIHGIVPSTIPKIISKHIRRLWVPMMMWSGGDLYACYSYARLYKHVVQFMSRCLVVAMEQRLELIPTPPDPQTKNPRN